MLVATEQMGIAVLDVANKSFTASTQIPCSFISEGLEEFNLTGNSVRSLLLDKYIMYGQDFMVAASIS